MNIYFQVNRHLKRLNIKMTLKDECLYYYYFSKVGTLENIIQLENYNIGGRNRIFFYKSLNIHFHDDDG